MIAGWFCVMRTFCIETLGCKVNRYEGEQLAALLRQRGLVQVEARQADLRVINTCSVTVAAASKSRQTVRRITRLPVLQPTAASLEPKHRGRTIVTGCWATSDRAAAASLPGVDAVLTHHDDIAEAIDRLLSQWGRRHTNEPLPEPSGNDGSIIEAGAPVGSITTSHSKPGNLQAVKEIPRGSGLGTITLPLLGEHQTGRQRALLKLQDGCDAHCTYCIIPQLRPTLWSKPPSDVVDEARRLVDSGHVEIVLTGIFLGAYGQPTALRRNQPEQRVHPLARLIDALCSQVPGLRRLRFSSLEPGDLSADLISAMQSHAPVVPHFHLPLQSGSDPILRRMNRQYRRDDFLRMIERVRDAFDRPAITTDIIVGFPGESDQEFQRTLELVDQARFIHIHAFSFSPRPGTAAARWQRDFVRGPVVSERIAVLSERAQQSSLEFRRSFLGQTVQVLVEQCDAGSARRHGRCERYFDVEFEGPDAQPGVATFLTVERVTARQTLGRRTAVPV